MSNGRQTGGRGKVKTRAVLSLFRVSLECSSRASLRPDKMGLKSLLLNESEGGRLCWDMKAFGPHALLD